MSLFIETDRLLIRELLPQDEAGMFAMDSDPEVHRYIGMAPVKTREESRAMLELVWKQYAENGVGRWAITDKNSGEFLGWTGFKLMKEPANGHIGHYDFGYRLTRQAWGRGIATEAGKAALSYGIDVMRLTPVFAMTDVNNAASRHVLEKLGFRFVEIFKFEGPAHWQTPPDRLVTWYELAGKGL